MPRFVCQIDNAIISDLDYIEDRLLSKENNKR